MARSPLALAALATVAIPGLDALDVRGLSQPGDDYDEALVAGPERRLWVVRAPRNNASGAALEREIALLTQMSPLVADGSLPFAVPVPVGFAGLVDGGRAVVHEQIPGQGIDLEDLSPGSPLVEALGQALAAIHEIPLLTAERLTLPMYGADEYRKRRQAEVDEAARSGHIPVRVLSRWESQLENVAWWRFSPTVVHGELAADRVLTDGRRITGLLGWGTTQVADPADDLAWVIAAAPPAVAEAVVTAYRHCRTDFHDPHLVDRAQLSSELAVARWLLYGVNTHDSTVIDEAIGMLTELDEDNPFAN